jgi:hypothetical protein
MAMCRGPDRANDLRGDRHASAREASRNVVAPAEGAGATGEERAWMQLALKLHTSIADMTFQGFAAVDRRV